MKKILPLLFLGLVATLLPSCCGLGLFCGSGKIVPAEKEKNYAMKEVTKYKMVTRVVDPGPKGGEPYEVEEKIAYTETVKVRTKCGPCGTIYCPTPGCCGTISPQVLKRATAQGGTGEPHIGLIPTMKVLVE